MSTYGYIVVTVEDHRTFLIGADDGEIRPTGNKVVFRVEDGEDPISTRVLDRYVDALREVRDITERGDLQERWEVATRNMDSKKMRRALEVLEA